MPNGITWVLLFSLNKAEFDFWICNQIICKSLPSIEGIKKIVCSQILFWFIQLFVLPNKNWEEENGINLLLCESKKKIS